MDTIAEALFGFLFNLINTFLNVLLTPLNVIITSFFNDIVFNDYLTNFYNIINTYIIPSVSWFVNILPPNTWSLMLLYFNGILLVYSGVLAWHYIVKILTIIKKLIPLA